MDRGGVLSSALYGVTALFPIPGVGSFSILRGGTNLGSPQVYSGRTLESYAGAYTVNKKKTTIKDPTLESREWSGGLTDAQAREK